MAVSSMSGHVMPMVHIGVGLRSAGHEVIVLSDAEFADTARRAGLRFEPLRAGAGVRPPAGAPSWIRHLPDQARRYHHGRTGLTAAFVEPLARQTESLRALLEYESADGVLADVTFTGVLPLLLSDNPRPPILVCGVGPLTLSSVDTPPFGMGWLPEPGFDYRRMTKVAQRIIMGGSQRRLNQALREVGSPAAPVFISDWPRLADGLLQLSVAGFEYPRTDLPPTVEFVGPVLPESAGDAPPRWWPDVLTASTVVHVTQGTFDNSDLSQLIGPTLEAFADRDDVLVVATTGGRSGQQLRGPVPPNARVIDWLPYSLLMPHVDVMVTNGGFGGVQHALRHGVPLVVAGETSDKAEVAARVQYSGAGINLGTATPSAADIRASVTQAKQCRGYRAAAAGLRHEIESSAPLHAIAAALERCRAGRTGGPRGDEVAAGPAVAPR
ncbi:MAG: hypothetical protein QOH57_1538 [Mycobacterium sp.]|nr:hypothetical protein [Mycobacterium sp.]